MITVKVVKPLLGYDIGATSDMPGRVARPLLADGVVERVVETEKVDAAPTPKRPRKVKA